MRRKRPNTKTHGSRSIHHIPFFIHYYWLLHHFLSTVQLQGYYDLAGLVASSPTKTSHLGKHTPKRKAQCQTINLKYIELDPLKHLKPCEW